MRAVEQQSFAQDIAAKFDIRAANHYLEGVVTPRRVRTGLPVRTLRRTAAKLFSHGCG
jgi:hypothetical protein